MFSWRISLLFCVAAAYGTSIPPSELHPSLANHPFINQFLQQDDEVTVTDDRSDPAEIIVEDDDNMLANMDTDLGAGAGGAGDDLTQEELDAMLAILVDQGLVQVGRQQQQSPGAAGAAGSPLSLAVNAALTPVSAAINTLNAAGAATIGAPLVGKGIAATLAAPLVGKAALVAAPFVKLKAKKALLKGKILKKLAAIKAVKFGATSALLGKGAAFKALASAHFGNKAALFAAPFVAPLAAFGAPLAGAAVGAPLAGAAGAASGALLAPLLDNLRRLGIDLGLQRQGNSLHRDLLEIRLRAPEIQSLIEEGDILDLTLGDLLILDLDSNNLNIEVGGNQDPRTGQSSPALGLF